MNLETTYFSCYYFISANYKFFTSIKDDWYKGCSEIKKLYLSNLNDNRSKDLCKKIILNINQIDPMELLSPVLLGKSLFCTSKTQIFAPNWNPTFCSLMKKNIEQKLVGKRVH